MLKDYDVDILYHPGKANVVADALSHKSMGILSYLQPQKRGLAHAIHQSAAMGVRIVDTDGTRVIVQIATTTCLAIEVKQH